MKQVPVWKFLDVPKLTPGRRRLALQRIREAIEGQRRLNKLLSEVDNAIAMQERTVALRAARPRSMDLSRMHAAEAGRLDAKLDRAVAALHGVLQSLVRAYESDEPHAMVAAQMLKRVFPGGVAPITQLPYVDQHAAVDQLLTSLRSDPELQEGVEALGLDNLVARIEDLNGEYGQHVTRREMVSAQDIRDADHDGWVALCKIVALIMGAVPGSTDEDDTLRATLMNPLLQQQDELRKLRARRAGGRLDELLDEEPPEDDDEEVVAEVPAEPALE